MPGRRNTEVDPNGIYRERKLGVPQEVCLLSFLIVKCNALPDLGMSAEQEAESWCQKGCRDRGLVAHASPECPGLAG